MGISIVTVWLALLLAFGALPASAASMVAIPNAGPPGALVTVEGSGFSGVAGSASLCWNRSGCSDLGSGLVVLGVLTAVVTVPASATPGTYTIHACQSVALDPCGSSAVATFTVTEPLITTTTTTTTTPSTTTTSTATTTTTPASSTTSTTPAASTTTTAPAQPAGPTTTVPATTTQGSDGTQDPPDDTTPTTTIAPTTTTVAGLSTTTTTPDDDPERAVVAPPEIDDPAPPLRAVDFLSFAQPEPEPPAPQQSLVRSITGWLTARVAAGPAALVLGPLVIVGVVLEAMVSAGSGLLAPTVLLVGQFFIVVWDRTEAGERFRRRFTEHSATA